MRFAVETQNLDDGSWTHYRALYTEDYKWVKCFGWCLYRKVVATRTESECRKQCQYLAFDLYNNWGDTNVRIVRNYNEVIWKNGDWL